MTRGTQWIAAARALGISELFLRKALEAAGLAIVDAEELARLRLAEMVAEAHGRWLEAVGRTEVDRAGSERSEAYEAYRAARKVQP